MWISGSALIVSVAISALSPAGATQPSSWQPTATPARPAASEQQGIQSPAGADPAGPPPVVPGQTVPGQTVPGQVPPAPGAPGVAVPAVPGQVPAAPIGRVFASEAGMIFNPIRPDKVVDFELVLGRIHEALVKSTDPVRRQQAAGWKAFKATEPGPNATVLYVFVMDPAVKGADYTVSKILSEAFLPAEVQTIYRLYNGAFAGGQSLLNLTTLEDYSGPVTVRPPAAAGTTPAGAMPAGTAPAAAPTKPAPGATAPDTTTPGATTPDTAPPAATTPDTTPSAATPPATTPPATPTPATKRAAPRTK